MLTNAMPQQMALVVIGPRTIEAVYNVASIFACPNTSATVRMVAALRKVPQHMLH